MEDDGTWYIMDTHFTVFCYILWTFGTVRGNLVHFSRFSILYQEKSGNPASSVISNVCRISSSENVSTVHQGCQMVYFHTKKSQFG
jgi:hypothetical protein